MGLILCPVKKQNLRILDNWYRPLSDNILRLLGCEWIGTLFFQLILIEMAAKPTFSWNIEAAVVSSSKENIQRRDDRFNVKLCYCFKTVSNFTCTFSLRSFACEWNREPTTQIDLNDKHTRRRQLMRILTVNEWKVFLIMRFFTQTKACNSTVCNHHKFLLNFFSGREWRI